MGTVLPTWVSKARVSKHRDLKGTLKLFVEFYVKNVSYFGIHNIPFKLLQVVNVFGVFINVGFPYKVNKQLVKNVKLTYNQL